MPNQIISHNEYRDRRKEMALSYNKRFGPCLYEQTEEQKTTEKDSLSLYVLLSDDRYISKCNSRALSSFGVDRFKSRCGHGTMSSFGVHRFQSRFGHYAFRGIYIYTNAVAPVDLFRHLNSDLFGRRSISAAIYLNTDLFVQISIWAVIYLGSNIFVTAIY